MIFSLIYNLLDEDSNPSLQNPETITLSDEADRMMEAPRDIYIFTGAWHNGRMCQISKEGGKNYEHEKLSITA